MARDKKLGLMNFSARRERNFRRSLARITVIENPDLGFPMGEELARFMSRKFYDATQALPKKTFWEKIFEPACVYSRAPGYHPSLKDGAVVDLTKVIGERKNLKRVDVLRVMLNHLKDNR